MREGQLLLLWSSVNVIWGYKPSALDQVVTAEWIAAHDCSGIEFAAIGEQSLAITSESAPSRPATTVRISRRADLGSDLAEAWLALQQQLASARAQRS